MVTATDWEFHKQNWCDVPHTGHEQISVKILKSQIHEFLTDQIQNSSHMFSEISFFNLQSFPLSS